MTTYTCNICEQTVEGCPYHTCCVTQGARKKWLSREKTGLFKRNKLDVGCNKCAWGFSGREDSVNVCAAVVQKEPYM